MSPGRAANSEWGRWGLVAPDCPGVAAKQSHSDRPQSWQSRCQSRLTCLCFLGHRHFTSACASGEAALTPPPSRVSTGQAESKQEAGPQRGRAPSPPSPFPGPSGGAVPHPLTPRNPLSHVGDAEHSSVLKNDGSANHDLQFFS